MHPQFNLPARGSINARSSSITAAFFQVITPVVVPTDAEVDEALDLLGMTSETCVCAYCGDPKTEWDHFRPTVLKRMPTGYITEIANLVPACGKCNQSKGNQQWRAWMTGNAKRSPARRGISDLSARVERLARFENWRRPIQLDYTEIVGEDLWRRHLEHLSETLAAMREAQNHAELLRARIEARISGH